MRRVYIDFMGNKKWLFVVSALLLAISIGALAVKGLNLGIEFSGGTVITLAPKAGVTETQVQDALQEQGIDDAVVQSQANGGYLVRTSEADTAKATEVFTAVSEDLGLSEAGGTVSTIGPGWGANVTRAAQLALTLSLAAIVLYISIRFEYKMSLTAIVALLHDVIITLGIYALVGREVTPNTIAALLTILGFSLYDTIVVFHRIRENGQRLVKQSFMQMANDSINQVLMRWVNTSISQIIPVVVLLVFGGETLQDFAFALLIGLVSGAYSSIAVASPLYAMWKEREPRYQALKKKYAAS